MDFPEVFIWSQEIDYMIDYVGCTTYELSVCKMCMDKQVHLLIWWSLCIEVLAGT
jgi:hypothetical protein